MVAVLAGRRLGTVAGVLAVPVVAVVALDWLFLAISYFLVLDCAGWEGRLPWLLWQLVPVFGYGGAIVLLIAGIRARRRVS